MKGIRKLKPKHAPCVCRITGRQLAPAMWEFDNEDTLATMMELGNIPCEEWSMDPTTGLVHIPGLGGVPMTYYLVADNGKLRSYWSLAAVLEHYDFAD